MINIFKSLRSKDYFYILIIIILILFQVWLDLKLPDYMSEITRLVQTSGSEMNEILKNGMYMLLCAFGSLALTIVSILITANLSANFSLNTRKRLFKKVESLSLKEIKEFSTSSLITRTTNDITQVEMLLAMGLQIIIKSPITAFMAITKIFGKNYSWSMVTLGAVLVLMSVIVILSILVVPRFKTIQKLTDSINNVTRENLTGIRVVRAFNAEKYQEEKFDKVNEDLTRQLLFNQKAFAVLSPVMYLVMYFLTLVIYFMGAYFIMNSVLSDKLSLFSDMIVFSSYAMQVIMSFLMIAFIFIFLPRANVSAKRINEVLNTKSSIKNGTKTSGETKECPVEFKNVSFKYPDAQDYLLKDISFEASKGEVIAIIGSTGSGKSTLINLIPRFYDVTEGEVLVDGINVKEYDLNYLNNKLGYATQKAVLFNESINDNIAFGSSKNKITKEDIKESIRIAQGKDFVEKMDDKYNSVISQNGTNISGGQKQRLSIARAIAKKPEIYIFDDSFSALDYKTDLTLRKELKKITKDAVTIIVAQRIGTIMNADKIIVLDNGEVKGIGSHKELLKKCEVYKEIAYSQLSKEELNNA